ncbi:head-tail connector protein [Alsobacter sp. SYSU M60028]|uniref:Head-tail connector protein n=1 Tax=Alsobacter ponti TaxID=2962936 RepID=A0ABT1L8F1_9HYPH|nr:head-tail connector protein [Alsobacter ponti]MCP8937786.1 head-tail connector protein [Alsobacter ponti]
MALTPIAPPAAEPLTLAEAKLWLRVDGDEEDALIGALVAAARAAVEAASGRLLVAQSWRWSLDAWPAMSPFALPVAPVRAVVAARVRDAAGLVTDLAADAFDLDAASDPPRLAWRGPPPPGPGLGGVEIDLAAGYGAPAAVPAPLIQAVRITLAALYEARGDASSTLSTVLPPAALALVAPFRRVRL